MVRPCGIQLPKAVFIGALTALWYVGLVAVAAAQLETRSTTGLPKHEPFQVAAADFNGDGKLDLAVVDQQLSILLGNGDGTFQKAWNTPYSGLEASIAAADFNRDGKMDVVITAGSTGFYSVVVFLGNGDGTFQPGQPYITTALPTFVAVGDFNNDGNQDLVIIDPPYISVLLGNGDGTFQSPSDNSSFLGPQWLAVGDFNNDDSLDVVVVGYQGGSMNVGVLLGNGDGTLQSSLTYPLNNTPASVTAADFNHDGNMDVAIGEMFGGVAVLLGKGDGSFQPEVDYVTNVAGGQVAAYDFNGDGKLDLLLTGVGLLLGNGDGTFGAAQIFPAAKSASGLAVGDLNGDRKLDVVVSDRISGEIALLNTGSARFAPSTPVTFASQVVNTTSVPQTVTFSNTGSTALSISSMKTSGEFQSTSNCGASVAAGASCAIKVSYHPLTPGWHNGLITLVDSASSKPQVIELSGLGTALKLSPATLNFGDQAVGTKSVPQQITVTNESDATVTFTSISIGGQDFQDFSETQNCGSALAPAASCSAMVTFQPRKTGNRNALASFGVVGGASPAPVVLIGTGT